MTRAWKNMDDATMDIWLFSDQDVDIHEPPTQPILQYNARLGANNNVSIFDAELPHEEVTYVSSGRGRGGLSKFFKPGLPVNSCLDEEEDIKRRLREVSGLGYSNELIEQHFKKTVPWPSPVNEAEFCDVLDDRDYQSSVNRSPEKGRFNSPVSSTTSLSSNTSSPKKKVTTDNQVTQQEMKTGNQTRPKEMTTNNQVKPLPLSLILKQAKEKAPSANKEIYSKVESSSSNNRIKNLKSQLNPDAAEFKSSPASSSGSANSIQDIDQASISDHERIPIEYDSRTNSRSRCSNINSAGEELAWRRRDGNDTSRDSFNWNRRGNGYTSEDDYSYRHSTASRRNGGKRDFSRMEVFDLHSDSDFPSLS